MAPGSRLLEMLLLRRALETLEHHWLLLREFAINGFVVLFVSMIPGEGSRPTLHVHRCHEIPAHHPVFIALHVCL